MPDRTTELKNDYEAMQGLLDRFQQRQTLKVSPEPDHRWYLFEKEGHDTWVDQYEPEMALYMQEYWGNKKGWTITPVDIFRSS